MTKSLEFLKNFWRIIPEKFRRISQEILETESQNCDPTKISHLGDQFCGISGEFPRNQSQEMILEKFLGKSGEIPHFCYLVYYFTIQVSFYICIEKYYLFKNSTSVLLYYTSQFLYLYKDMLSL